MDIEAVGIIVLILITASIIRIIPRLKKKSIEVDANYFLLTAEEFKKQKKIPIRLPPYYLLDIDTQWYPPLFSVFLGMIPKGFLRNKYWIIPSVLDVSNLALLLIITYTFSNSLLYLIIVGLTYSLIPALTNEYLTLTSRALANLLLSFAVLSLLYSLLSPSIFIIGPAVLFCYLALLTHKMTTQFIIFFYTSLSIILYNFIPLFVFFSSILLLLITLRSYYLDILRGHYDIVLFWHRNWKNLWAHQIYDSNFYSDISQKIYDSKEKILKGSFRPLFFLLQSIIGKNGNPFLILPFLTIGLNPTYLQDFYWNFFQYWSILTILIIILVTIVPQLRLFGEGYKYSRMSAIPNSILAGEIFISGSLLINLILLSLMIFAASRWISIYRFNMKDRMDTKDDFEQLLNFINSNPALDYIMCFRGNISDSIVYYCKRHVLWGTHHDCFNTKVADFYPVLKKPLEWFIKEYGIKYIVIDKNYADPNRIGLRTESEKWSSKNYAIYSV